MKTIKSILLILAIVSLTSCATICNGRYYTGTVDVYPKQDDISIYFNGLLIGENYAQFSNERKNANNVIITLEKPGCEKETYFFNKRHFSFTPLLFDAVLFNYGTAIIIDAITGAWFSPDEMESGVEKIDKKNYKYKLIYIPTKSNKYVM